MIAIRKRLSTAPALDDAGPAKTGGIASVLVFGLALGSVLLYALRGGSYDVVVRQELGLAIWWILLLGFATGLLPRARLSGLVVLPLVGFAAMAVLMLVALPYTESDERTVDELARVLHHGGLVTLVLSVMDQRTWKAAAGGLTTGTVLVSFIALASRLTPSLFPADVVDQVLQHVDRLNYPLNYWNALAALTAMAAVLLLGLSAHSRQAAARAVALAAIPAVLATMYLTYARGAYLAVGVGLIALIALVPHRGLTLLHGVVAGLAGAGVIIVIRSQEQLARNAGFDGAPKVLAACVLAGAACAVLAVFTTAIKAESRLRMRPTHARILGAAAGLAVVVGAAVWGPSLVERTVDAIRARPPSAVLTDPEARLSNLSSGRYEIWEAALDVHRSQPRHGIGPGTFEFAWNRNRHYTHFVRDAHSLYLESAAEGGWLGLVAVLVTLGGLLTAGIAIRVRNRVDAIDTGYRATLLAGFVVFLTYAGFDWMWEATAVAACGLAAAAIALASASPPRRHRAPPLVRIGLVVLALAAAAVEIPGLVSNSKVRESQDAAGQGDLAIALSAAEDAVAAAPWASTPFVQRGLILERYGRLADARLDLLRAIRREPTNYRPRLVLARVEAELGRAAPALKAFRAARGLAPRKPVFSNRRPP